MALNGSITKKFYNNGYSLILEWTATQSITNNTSTITSKLYLKSNGSSYNIYSSANKTVKIKIDGSTYTITNAKVGLSGNQKRLLYTKSKTVTHKSNGTKSVSMGGSAGIKVDLKGTWYDTVYLPDTNFALKTIPRASSVSAVTPTVNLGSTISVKINRASSSFLHTVTYKLGSHSYTAYGVSTSNSYTLPLSWCDAIPNNYEKNGTVTISTYHGNTKIGESSSAPFNALVPSGINPIISSVTIEGQNLLDGNYVKGVSKAKVTMHGESGVYGSTISSRSISGAGYKSNSKSFTTGVINASGKVGFTASVTDSRGRPGYKTASIENVEDYAHAWLRSAIVHRVDNNGNSNENGNRIKVRPDVGFSSINGVNEARNIYFKYRTKSTNWSENISINNKETKFFNADVNYSYEVKLYWGDRLFDGFNRTFLISSSKSIIDIKENGKGLAFFKASEEDNAVEFGQKVKADLIEVENIKIGSFELEASGTNNHAGFHNSIYRGKCLGENVTDSQYNEIRNGTFKDLYIGDYWWRNGRVYRIACFNYYMGCGHPTRVTRPHVTIVPDKHIDIAPMNTARTTAGGYLGSEMGSKNLQPTRQIIYEAFPDHVLGHRIIVSNAVTNGRVTGTAWINSAIQLMTERMVLGNSAFSPGSDGVNITNHYALGKTQFPLFAFNPSAITCKKTYWLRDVACSKTFSVINPYGGTHHYYANEVGCGIRPVFSII